MGWKLPSQAVRFPSDSARSSPKRGEGPVRRPLSCPGSGCWHKEVVVRDDEPWSCPGGGDMPGADLRAHPWVKWLGLALVAMLGGTAFAQPGARDGLFITVPN